MAAERERGLGTASAEIGKYLDILAKDPNSRVFAPLAEAYRKAGLVDDAIATALEGLRVHPNYLGGRVALGRAYFEKRQFPEAAAEMRRVVAAAPDNLMAHRVLGQIARAQNDLPAAEKAFRMVLLLDPGDQEARQFVADAVGAAPAMAAPAGQTKPVTVGQGVAEQPAQAAPVQPQPPGGGSEAPASMTFEIPPVAEAPTPTDFETGEPRHESLAGGPESPASPEPAEEFPIDLSEEFAIESPLEFAEGGAQARQLPETASPSRAEAATEPVTDAGLELEVFTRVAWGEDLAPVSPPSEQPAGPAEPEGAPAAARGARSTGAETGWEAFREISFDAEEPEFEPAGPQPIDGQLLEVFTREPAVPSAPAASPPNRGQGGGARDIEIETTAYLPPEDFDEAEVPPSPSVLEEELQPVDLKGEAGLEFPEEAEQAFGLAPEPVLEPVLEPEPVVERAQEVPASTTAPAAPEPGWELEPPVGPLPSVEPEGRPEPPLAPIEPTPHGEAAGAFEPLRELEPETQSVSEAEFQPGAFPEPAPPPGEAPLEPSPTPEPEPDLDLGLGHELEFVPEVDFPPELEPVPEAESPASSLPSPGPLGQEYEELTEEEPPSAAPAGLGVFDTETLASIYVKQGFYERAAEIYQRLLAQRPGDENLRRRLDEALDLAADTAGSRGAAATAATPAPPGAATPVSAEAKVDRLQRLLEAFMEGRPA